MNRRMSASGWCAAVVGGLLLTLPAAAAKKDPETCRYDCQTKATRAVESCSQSCSKEKDDVAMGKCTDKCGDKYRAAQESCDKTCPPIPKPPPPTELAPKEQAPKKH